MWFFVMKKVALLEANFIFYKSLPVCLASSLPLYTHRGKRVVPSHLLLSVVGKLAEIKCTLYCEATLQDSTSETHNSP